MTLEDEVAALRAENALLRAELAAARARIAELEKRKTPAPGFVQANTERKDRSEPRRKRAPEHNAGRRRGAPTQTVQHAYERCPDRGYLLRGGGAGRRPERAGLWPGHPRARARPLLPLRAQSGRRGGDRGAGRL